jgi:hypothetical protein
VPWASNQLPCEQLVKADPLHRKGDTCPSTTTLPSGRATFSCTYDQSVARLLRYVMPTHDGVLTVSVRQSIVFPKGA